MKKFCSKKKEKECRFYTCLRQLKNIEVLSHEVNYLEVFGFHRTEFQYFPDICPFSDLICHTRDPWQQQFLDTCLIPSIIVPDQLRVPANKLKYHLETISKIQIIDNTQNEIQVR